MTSSIPGSTNQAESCQLGRKQEWKLILRSWFVILLKKRIKTCISSSIFQYLPSPPTQTLKLLSNQLNSLSEVPNTVLLLSWWKFKTISMFTIVKLETPIPQIIVVFSYLNNLCHIMICSQILWSYHNLHVHHIQVSNIPYNWTKLSYWGEKKVDAILWKRAANRRRERS